MILTNKSLVFPRPSHSLFTAFTSTSLWQSINLLHYLFILFFKNVVEQSVDSGTGTIATVSTGLGTSRSSRSNFGKAGDHKKSLDSQADDEVFITVSSDHHSDVWPRHSHGQHPPSPPVRQRARYMHLQNTDQWWC